MKKVTVSASRTYDIIIGNNLIDSAGALSSNVISPCRAVVISDDTVAALYSERLIASLTNAGYSVKMIVIPHGEESKSAENYIKILNFLADEQLSRSDCIFALGGGVVGDLAGFVAATYLRGIRFVQIPTTLLSMVDSSVGGKTAINLCAGKNLAGVFYQPSLVICDYSTLSTLPDEIFLDGCAEVIKYGIINDKPLFEKLKSPIMPQIEDIIANCIKNKRDIVERDERDNGVRQLLNLGHTVGHAIEKCSNFEISHGSAVAMGTAIITRASFALGYCKSEDRDEIIALLSSYGLPTDCPYSAKELAHIAMSDKKRAGDKINLVIPFAIGDCQLVPTPIDNIENIFAAGN
ncbi:MAG: 3-dehydroquinate synthase [Ruminococcaceae bacterium]|nr:3-dehydroquinate synthase [Oscillospiraceae bacterium]